MMVVMILEEWATGNQDTSASRLRCDRSMRVVVHGSLITDQSEVDEKEEEEEREDKKDRPRRSRMVNTIEIMMHNGREWQW